VTTWHRLRHKAPFLVDRCLRLLRQHYFSLITAAVLSLLAFLALTSNSFESHRPAAHTVVRSTQNESDAALALQPQRHRIRVLFYVVEDAQQRDAIADAVASDRFAFESGTPPVDEIIYLIAGTKEEEERTIDRLNFEDWAAQQSRIDIRVIDVRGSFE
jgi:hypothetical protein